jgi:hypothetical protein
VLGPSLPIDWAEGQRFSAHHRAHCASEAELDQMRVHAGKVWALELEGAVADDGSLQRLPDLPDMEILELKDSALRGPGLAALAAHPLLRVLRIYLAQPAELLVPALPLSALEVLDLVGLPARPWGSADWSTLPSLKSLTLESAGDLYLEGALPGHLESLTLTATNIAGESHLPEALESLSLHLHAANEAQLESWLAELQRVSSLSLRSTPVSDGLVERLAARWPLAFLDVVDTGVSTGLLQRLTEASPNLRVLPRVDVPR